MPSGAWTPPLCPSLCRPSLNGACSWSWSTPASSSPVRLLPEWHLGQAPFICLPSIDGIPMTEWQTYGVDEFIGPSTLLQQRLLGDEAPRGMSSDGSSTATGA